MTRERRPQVRHILESIIDLGGLPADLFSRRVVGEVAAAPAIVGYGLSQDVAITAFSLQYTPRITQTSSQSTMSSDVQGLALFDRLGHEGVDCARLGRIVLSQVTREDVSGSASWVSFRT